MPTSTASRSDPRYVKVESKKPIFYDRARFYTIAGKRLPSVTTILGVIDKPGLGPWYAKMERQAFETAILEIASSVGPITGIGLLDQIMLRVGKAKAGDKAKDKAANIGSGAHAWIEWETKRRLGKDAGPEPKIPDESLVATMAWQDWARSADFQPVRSEFSVYSLSEGYAGTADWLARVNGKLTLGDYKTGKAIYPESYLQNVAYRHAAHEMGAPKIEHGLIVRLPKTLDDPEFEAAPVPEIDFDVFRSALVLWKFMRQMDGRLAS